MTQAAITACASYTPGKCRLRPLTELSSVPLAIVSRGSRESVAVLMDLDELVDQWTLLKDERELVAGKRGPTRLGFALLLKFYARAGRFPLGRAELDDDAVAFVARQVGVPASDLGPQLPSRLVPTPDPVGLEYVNVALTCCLSPCYMAVRRRSGTRL